MGPAGQRAWDACLSHIERVAGQAVAEWRSCSRRRVCAARSPLLVLGIVAVRLPRLLG